jgi:hypothetical protein
MIEAAASGTFSKSVGAEEASPLTAFTRSVNMINSVAQQISTSISQHRGVTVAFGIKIAPTGEVMLSGSNEGSQFHVTVATPSK